MDNITFDINHPWISVYQTLTSKMKKRAKIIAEAIDSISKEFPNLIYVTTQDDLTNTKLELLIEEARRDRGG